MIFNEGEALLFDAVHVPHEKGAADARESAVVWEETLKAFVFRLIEPDRHADLAHVRAINSKRTAPASTER